MIERPACSDRWHGCRSGGWLRVVVAAVAVFAAQLPLWAPHGVEAAPAGASRLEVVVPERMADTRLADCTCTMLTADTIRVQIAGRKGVPATAVAAALTITVAGATAVGYATVWPSGTARRETSTLNWAAGQTRANGTIVQLGDGGSVDVYVFGSFDRADVIIDVTGVFVPVDAGTGTATGGRLQALSPDRRLDTRGSAPVAGGSTVRMPLPTGVPADAVALVVNVTATQSVGNGYLTVFAAGANLPPTSTVNTDGPGQSRAAMAIVPVSSTGIDVFVSSPMHAIVDVFGWFTGPSSPSSDDGLFVPVVPMRMFDTRPSPRPAVGGYVRELSTDTLDGAVFLGTIQPNASALVLNATVTGSVTHGWLTAFPARTPRPATSSLNWAAGETVANLTISPVSTETVGFFANATTDLIVDLTGYFTGTPVPATEPAPPIPPIPAYQDPVLAALVQRSVPAEVWAVLSNVKLDYFENPSCSGPTGLTISNMGPGGFAAIRLARGLTTVCSATKAPESTAAHEVGHVLATRWIFDSLDSNVWTEREALLDGLDGGHECIAEAIGQQLFAMKGIGPYFVGYGGAYQQCALANLGLAQQIIAAAVD